MGDIAPIVLGLRMDGGIAIDLRCGGLQDADLEALGKQRALAIQGALVAGQVDPGRVFIVVAPPLTISEKELDEAMTIFDEAFTAFEKGNQS